MTETENVSKKLIEDAENTKNKILAEAREKLRLVSEEASDAQRSIEEKGKTLAEKAYKQKYDFTVAQLFSKMDQRFLEEKIKIVDEVISDINERLKDLPAKDLKKLLLKFANGLDFKEAVYQLGKDERNITDSLVKEVFASKKLIRSPEEPNFTKGLKVIDKRKEYYFSETALLDADSEEIKMEISKLLFT